MARVRDRDGNTVLVAIYVGPPSDTPRRVYDIPKFVVGHTVALLRARPHRVADGQIGFRVEDPAQLSVRNESPQKNPYSTAVAQVFPVSLSTVLALGDLVRKERLILKCSSCDRAGGLRCTRCATKYCGRVSNVLNHSGM
jgi:hypothetical protein